jgi:hypothetical protein
VIAQSFFSPAQACVGESALDASVAINTPSRGVMASNYGMDPQALPKKVSRGDWSQQMVGPSVSTGKSQRVVFPPAIPTGIVALAAESPAMAPKLALKWRRLKALSPYDGDAWASELTCLGLLEQYPHVVHGLANGFDLGIPQIYRTYTPQNHHSLSLLLDVYSAIVQNEFKTGQYISPFTCQQVEAALGPFQSSPLSLVPKASKPGKYQAVHNFSHPHHPLPNATSINLCIDSDEYPCTWGTFSSVPTHFAPPTRLPSLGARCC